MPVQEYYPKLASHDAINIGALHEALMQELVRVDRDEHGHALGSLYSDEYELVDILLRPKASRTDIPYTDVKYQFRELVRTLNNGCVAVSFDDMADEEDADSWWELHGHLCGLFKAYDDVKREVDAWFASDIFERASKAVTYHAGSLCKYVWEYNVHENSVRVECLYAVRDALLDEETEAYETKEMRHVWARTLLYCFAAALNQVCLIEPYTCAVRDDCPRGEGADSPDPW